MEIRVRRIARKSLYTIGKLEVLNCGKWVWICDTIEDRDRGLKQSMSESEIRKIKVKNQTAIPSGKYVLTIAHKSPKFSQKPYYANFCKGYLPRLLDVPGFDGILMHRGVNQNSSSGCIILGYNTVVGAVTNSQKAFEQVYSMLRKAHERSERITIEVI